ncbi:NAD-dependent epimerase/dehydratase family protein [Aeromicrobium sp. CF3.5]|uniref:NAD-dependent epimerase/dehydratase family protein n=1 Tax=Aeromicrobium sp. CF3.5 TaxID=3373078 RepID=UPI003EE58B26
MRILLTGGTGFIGSAVLERLVEAGHQVTAVVRSQSSSLAVEKTGGVAVIGDLFDPEWVASELSTHDAGIHTAAGGDEQDPALNDAVIAAAIEAFSDTDKPFVHTGGVWVYGSNPAISEDSELAPPAVVSWRPESEQRLLESDVRASVIQPGIVYGHGQGIPAMVAAGPVPGTGEQHWATVHVDDLADLYLLALDVPGGHAYIAASGSNPTVAELAQAAGTDQGPEGDAATLERLGPFGEALVLDQQVSGAKAKALGWEPQRPSLVEELAAGYTS